MAEDATYIIVKNSKIAKDVFCMRLSGPSGAMRAPGQFVNLQLPGLYLRRPFSVSRWDADGLEIVYKVVGEGTAQMAAMAPGRQLKALAGLGRGFGAAPAKGRRALLVGGGVGAPPLYALARALCAAGAAPAVALGFASAEDVFFQEEFEALGCGVLLATEDGSRGSPGYVTALLDGLDFGYYYACGPNAMLAALHALAESRGIEGQLSFEARMGCGFGACMGCSCHTQFGPKRVCADGPVFTSREVKF